MLVASGSPAGVTMIGRQAEMSRLIAARTRALAERNPQLVLVVGPSGVGKSRLVDEWLARIGEPRDEGGAGTVLRAGAVDGDGPLATIARLLRAYLGARDGVGEEAAEAAVRAGLERILADAQATALAGPLLRLLGGAPGATRRVDELLLRRGGAALRRLLEIEARRRPLVVALEDMQWADDESIALLTEVMDGLREAPLLLALVARGEMLERHPGFGGVAEGPQRELVEVAPLARPEVEALLGRHLPGAGRLPRELVDDVLGATGGNPRALTELVRLYHAEGAVARTQGIDGRQYYRIDAERARRARLPVPPEATVEARIAALTPPERALLECAATFGNVFWLGALVALGRSDHEPEAGVPLDPAERRHCQEQVDELVRRGYVMPVPGSSLAGELEYAFQHNLERERVERATARERAQRLARRAASWFESRIGAERNDEELEFLADLQERAGSRADAARTWLGAADGARARYAHEAAARCYRRGIALLEADDLPRRIDALHDLGDVLARRGHNAQALERFEEMLQAAWHLDNAAKAGAAHGRIGRLHRVLGDLDQAEHHMAEALDLFSRATDDRGVAASLDDLGKVSFLRGDWARSIERHSSALELRRLLGDTRSIALAAHNLGQASRAAGATAEAVEHLDEALRLRRQCGDRYGMAWSLLELGRVWRDRGDVERALRVLRDGLVHARDTGDREVEVQLLLRLGEALAFAGRHEEASQTLAEADLVAEAAGDRLGRAEALRLRGASRLALGDPHAALALSEQALALVEETGSRHQRALAHRAVASVLLHSALPEDKVVAERSFRAAMDLLSDLGQEADLRSTLVAYGAFLERHGESDEAAAVRLRIDVLDAEAPAPSTP